MNRYISYENYLLIELVNWEFTKFWMTFYLFNRLTARQLSKITSWKMKASTLQLPTLDILNKNYPDILKGLKTCFLCKTENETNLHLWQCQETLTLLAPIFNNFVIKL